MCCSLFQGRKGQFLALCLAAEGDGVTFYFYSTRNAFYLPKEAGYFFSQIKVQDAHFPTAFHTTVWPAGTEETCWGLLPGVIRIFPLTPVLLLVFPSPVLFSMYSRMLSTLRAVDNPCISQGPDRSQKPCWMFEQRKFSMRNC